MNIAMTDESCGVQYAAISHWHKEDETVLKSTYLPGKESGLRLPWSLIGRHSGTKLGFSNDPSFPKFS